ncbi:MAG: response regulator [Spirochaetaceae bacterium]|nr:response regulator [Spirochaetaceae bacterium]
MNNPLILVIEDEKPVRNFLCASIKTQDYRVLDASTGREALAMTASYGPDLILLDLGLPDMDGIDVIRRIREFSAVPILVLSARGMEWDKVEALDEGADDYLAKPFGVPELMARIRAGLRRSLLIKINAETGTAIYNLASLTVDLERRIVQVDNKDIHVTPTEFKLLSIMVRHPGKVLTHSFLLKEVWGPGAGNDTQSLRVFMANLRRKLEKDPASPQIIKTEVGVGYRIIEE